MTDQTQDEEYEDQDTEPTTMAPPGESPTDPGPIRAARDQEELDEDGGA